MRTKAALIVFSSLLVVAAGLALWMPSRQAQAYRGSSLHFSGDAVSSGDLLSDGTWVSPINYYSSRPYYPESNGNREPNVYPLPSDVGTARRWGSAGYVMPDKQWRLDPSGNRYARGVDNGGGAVGTMALYGMGEDEKTSNSPEDNASRKDKLYKFLKSKNESGSPWERMGSAHIVHQMLGHNGPWDDNGNSGRDITPLEWNEFENRLVKNSKVWMVYVGGVAVPDNTSAVQMSSGVNPRIDVIDDDNPNTAAIWSFKHGTETSHLGGTEVYALEIICANPIGDLPGLPEQEEYSLTPTVSTSPASAINAGSTVTPSSSVANVGVKSDSTNWRVTRFEFAPGDSASTTGNNGHNPCSYFENYRSGTCATVANGSHTFNADSTTNHSDISGYKVPDDTPNGTKICYAASVNRPTHNSSPAWKHSSLSCVTVSNYTLTPTISIGSGLVNPGSSITASGTVSNNSSSNSKNNVRWTITRFDYSSNPSSTIRAAKHNSSSTPCVAFTGELAGCSDGNVYNSGANQTIPSSGRNTSRDSLVSNDTPGGRYICFVTSVQNPTISGSPAWSHSQMECRKVRDFTLTPTISINSPSSLAEPGVAITGTGRVGNSSGSDPSISRTWRITRYVYNKAPSSTVKSPVSGNASLDPCKAFERPSDGRLAGTDGCDMTGSNRSTGGVSAGANASGLFSEAAPETGQGNDRRWVCFVASVQLPTEHPSSPAWAHSNMECKRVRNYDLIPEVGSTTGGSVVETGGDIKITTTVTNGSSASSDETGSDIKWRVTKYVYTPESAKPTTSAHLATRTSNKERNSQAPCPDDFIQPSFPGSCAEIWSQEEPLGTGTVSPINVDHPGFSVAVPDNYDVGTKLCFVASVSRPTANPSPIWRHSDMYCLTVGKSPKIHVWGGDVRSHGEIRTSLSTAHNTRYGSWGEYGALSQGCNETQGFASGSGLLGGASMAGGLPRSSWSQLTFKNTGTGSCGGYGGYSLEPDFDAVYGAVSGQFEAGGAVRSNPSLQFTGGNLNSLNGLRWANSVTINTSSISSGRTVIIDAAGTVTINGNIQYANGGGDGYGSVSDIPQVIIRASNINISDNVTRVDAWLLTDGNLNTCSSIDVSSKYSLSDEDCDRPLEINGPVVAERVYLLRTRGADSTSRSEPAEKFNLRADAYMWGSAFSADSGRIRTVYSRELPPRF